MGRILKKRMFMPIPFIVFTTCLLLLLIFQTDGFAKRQSQEVILRANEKIYSGDNNQNVHASPLLLLRRMKREGLSEDVNKTGNNDGNKCLDKKQQLQDDNASLRRLITEKEFIIQNQTGGITKIRDDLKRLDDDAKRLITEKKNELAPWKARHFRHTHGNSQIYLAARKGDERGVKELTQLGKDAKFTFNNSETAIILAAVSRGDDNVALKTVKYFVENQADVLATDNEGLIFSHKLASNESLLSSGKFQKLAKELIMQQTDTLLLIHGNGVELTLFDKNGNSVLFYDAIGSEAHPLLSYLNLEQVYLGEAINAEDETLIRLLLRWGADVNGNNNQSETPLHLAASSRNKAFVIDTTKFLINIGANVYAQDKQNRTFLHKMVTAKDGETIDPAVFHDMSVFLIEKDLSGIFNATDNNGMTPFQRAVRHGMEIERGTLSLLKNNSVDFNAVDNNGNSVLWLAIFANQKVKLITDLVDLGANPCHLNKMYQSMLHAAAYKGNLGLLKFFLDRELNVNARDQNWDTPLHSAIYGNNRNLLKVVEFLLIKGADKYIYNKGRIYPHQLLSRKFDSSSTPDYDKIFDFLYYPGKVIYEKETN